MGKRIAVVVPCYQVERHLAALVARMPPFVSDVVLVNDASTDGTAHLVESLARSDRRVTGVHHMENTGVGGAMVTGFRKALELGADVVVKIDGDGQMPPEKIPLLIRPLLDDRADYVKGNRFRHGDALRKMPFARRLGNLALSFAVKLGSGYWRSFDPCNGFVAIRREVLAVINLDAVDRRYFFEISMLGQLSLVGAVVRDVAMPAIYGDEVSHLRIKRVLREFPSKLLAMTVRRWVLRKLTFDFTMDGLYLFAGVPLIAFAAIFGGINWYHYGKLGVPTPTGTIMIATLALVIGVQFLVQAVSLDILSEPSEPVSDRWPESAMPSAERTTDLRAS